MPTVFALTAALTLALILALIAATAWSIARPHQRLWPPPQQHPAQFAGLWGLTVCITVGMLTLGLLDWNPHHLPAALRWPIGGGLLALGHAMAWTAAFQTGLLVVAGKHGPLITTGLYARTRNPQYLGDLAMVAGWAALTASPRTAALCGLAAVSFLLFPFAEEPWLHARHGNTYRAHTPRFV